MEVGIRELRGRLSGYLDQVRAGQEIVVTDRGVAIARLVPMGERPFDRLVRTGLIQPAIQERRSRPQARRTAWGPVSELVAEQRR